jgi:dihydroceramidase
VALPPSPPGLWTSLGTAASVDWCEANYAVVSWIAEFWNTLSSIPILAAGLIGFWLCRRTPWVIAPRFPLVFAGIALVGLGSVAFHGTLLAVPQALDELPMVYVALLLAYCLRFGQSEGGSSAHTRWRWGLCIFGAGFTLAYFTSETYFLIFIASFAAVVAWLCIQGGRVAHRPGGGTSLRALYWTAAGSFVGAFLIFWLPERFLGCDHPLQGFQLHALFHLMATVGTYTAGLVMLYDRLQHRGCDPQLTWQLPAPFLGPPRN